MKTTVLALLLLLSGCVSFNSDDVRDPTARWPDFPNTPKPQLEVVTREELTVSDETLRKLVNNDAKLKTWGARLDAQIQEYMKIKKAKGK